VLSRLLAGPAPSGLAQILDRQELSAAARETGSLFALAARTREVYGRELLGPFIVSMTRSSADILTVLALARWAGCAVGWLRQRAGRGAVAR
jgi:phosphoenolpyruvate carboxylase